MNESQKLKSVENELIQVKKQYNDLLTRAKTIRDTEIAEKIISIYKSVVGAETNLNLTKRELNTVTRNAINYMAQEENSYAQLAAKVNMMNVALSKMTIEQRTNSGTRESINSSSKRIYRSFKSPRCLNRKTPKKCWRLWESNGKTKFRNGSDCPRIASCRNAC